VEVSAVAVAAAGTVAWGTITRRGKSFHWCKKVDTAMILDYK